MKPLQKNELKLRLTELVEQSQKLKDLYDQLDIDYLGDDMDNVEEDELDERVCKFYDFIADDDELNKTYKDFKYNISCLL